MRSITATIALAVAAAAMVALAAIQITRGNLDQLFRDRHLEQGAPLYQFNLNEVQQITLAGSGVNARLVRSGQQWRTAEPWSDRADPRLTGAILAFSLATRVEDAIPRTEIAPRQFGLETGAVAVRFDNRAGNPLATFVLGRRTAWYHKPPEGQPEPTLFIRPLEPGRSRYVYACTGDILPAFRDGFRLLRDHRPFYFHPDNLLHIRIKGPEGELTLGRESRESPWRILKPLELPTEKDSIRRLIEGLYNLTASKVSNPADQTLPETPAAAPGSIPLVNAMEIALRSANENVDTVLKVFPPANAAARTSLATVSNRDAVFELPLRSEHGLTGVAELPVAVNDLRDKALTRLNIASLQAVLIEPAESPPILVARKKDGPWLFRNDQAMLPVDERKVFALFKTVTEEKVAAFVTDAATDPAPHGLDKPFLTLRFLSFENEALELKFGRAPDGAIHAQRTGTPTVVRVDESLVSHIATRAHQWKAPGVWRLSVVDVTGIERLEKGQPPVTLTCNFLSETWGAKRGDADMTARLNVNRATFLLNALEQLQANRWLAPADSTASKALLDPQWKFVVTLQSADDDGNEEGTSRRELRVTPVSSAASNTYFYAGTSTDPDCFILDQETFEKLTIGLFDSD